MEVFWHGWGLEIVGMGENMRICSKQMETLVETSKSDFLPSVLRSFFVYLGSWSGPYITDKECVKAELLLMGL